MNENNIKSKKLEILRDLLVDEDHTIDDLKRLVVKSKPFIMIENKTGKVLISHDRFPFGVIEKATLYLIGIYFTKELGLNLDLQVTSRDISDNINVAQTTLSGPLGELVNKNIVDKSGGSYSIKYYEIEKILDALTNKYLASGLVVQKNSTNVKPKSDRRKNKVVKREVNEEIMEQEIKRYELGKEELNSIFSIDRNSIILLRGFKGNNLIESHIRSTLLVLTANKLYFNLDEIDSSELRRVLENSGVENLIPLSTNLKRFPNYIIHKRGPIGSTKNTYHLTNLGLQKGIVIIKDIVNNTKNFNLEFKPSIKRELSPPILIEKEKLMKNISEFSKYNELEEKKLRTKFDFETDNLRLLIKPTEKKRKALQIKSLMLLGVILKRVYGVNSFNGKKLLKDSRISNDRLDLLDSNKKYNMYFSKKPKSVMQLTYAGELKALELIKEIVNERND